MSDQFYRTFEANYRGSRELIKERLKVYLPFVEPLLATYPAADAIDLGCGRGEWLELLAISGFRPMGVDLDPGMLEVCIELGLPVKQVDALAHLAALPDNSHAIVSSFHVVEHISFDQLRTLVAEALRVLKPGGLLIMETPNPENIVVATRNFYLDPTHQRPIPSMLLSFVAEYSGFARVKTLRLQESKELANQDEVSLHDVFSGASPDYAVVAQKQAPEDVLSLTNHPFSLDYGLSLDSLLGRWDRRFERLETKAQQAETKAQQAETKAQQAETKAQQAETKAQQAETIAQQAETKAQQAEIASNERLAQLQAIYASRSWRITRPLRGIKRLLKGDFTVFWPMAAAAKLKAKQMLRPAVADAIIYVNTRPALRDQLKRLVSYFPWLRYRLIRVAMNSHRNAQASFAAQQAVPLDLQNMTPRARQIYQDLKTAIENKNKGGA